MHRTAVNHANEWLKRLLKQGLDPNSCNSEKDTALHKVGAFGGNPEAIQILLSAGADVNRRDGNGQTPLHSTFTSNGGIDAARELVKKGANVDAIDEYLRTPTKAITLLLKSGADPGYFNQDKAPIPLYCAIFFKSGTRVVFFGYKGVKHTLLELGRKNMTCAINQNIIKILVKPPLSYYWKLWLYICMVKSFSIYRSFIMKRFKTEIPPDLPKARKIDFYFLGYS